MRIPRSIFSQSDIFRTLPASLAAAFLLASAAFAQPAVATRSGEPLNLGELKQQILVYRNSGDYERQLAAVAAKAQANIGQRAVEALRPPLVLDIDETSLSNWPQIMANDFGYIAGGACDRLPKGPCGVRAWDRKATAPAIKSTLMLFNAARAKGVSVFFVTSRDESERAATIRNLRRAGYRGWAKLIMKPVGLSVKSAADFKAPERAKIAARGFTIIANMGDQPSDLAGGNPDDRAAQFLLPNPFYRLP